MLAAISHRGTWPPRLSTMASACIGELSDATCAAPLNARAAIVADARIDNKPELSRLLASHDGAATQTLLQNAYELWGEACAQRLLGDFAIAIWDAQRKRLVCVREHLGVRPLFYCHLPGKLFAFASEVKALLAIPDFVARLDEASIADFLARV